MTLDTGRIGGFLNVVIILGLTSKLIEASHYPYTPGWNLLRDLGNPQTLQEPSRPSRSKVVFPVPEDAVNRSYLPDFGFLTDLAFLVFLPRDLPASGLVRLSRDIFESEECVQYVSCEMTKVAQRHSSLRWVNNFLQDFPFQGDVADRLKLGNTDAITKFNKKKGIAEGNEMNNNGSRRRTWLKEKPDDELCTFSCHPIGSLTKGMKILSLLHDLVRTVRF